jgi:hypothetical protein
MTKKFPETLKEIPVKLFKLISGEQIVAYTHPIEESNGELIGIEEPMNVINDSEHSYVMTPWLPFSSEKIHVLENFNVLLSTDVDTDIKAYYMRMVLDAVENDLRISEEAIIESSRIRGNATTH